MNNPLTIKIILTFLHKNLLVLSVLGGHFFAQGQAKIIQKQNIFPLQTQHVHSSSMIELTNGDLLSCWFQGSGERKADDVKIMGSRLKKGAKKWEEPFIMSDTPGFPDCNPVLFLNQKNELFLFWLVIKSNRWEESVLKYKKSTIHNTEGAPNWNWQDIILLKPGEKFQKSTQSKFEELPDRGLGWAEYAPLYEKMIVEAAGDKTKRQSGWMTRTQALQLESGRIILPLYSDGFNFSIMAISDDQGGNWRSSEPIVGYGNVQPALVHKKNGTLVAYMRDNGDRPMRILRSVSHDKGESWSAVTDTKIYNPGSSLHTLNLPNGDWLMVNNNLEMGRNALHLNHSKDEGRTWNPILEIEKSKHPDDSYSYPTLIVTQQGEIHLSYSLRSKQQKTIVHATISL
jgi:predicted neuraminidase